MELRTEFFLNFGTLSRSKLLFLKCFGQYEYFVLLFNQILTESGTLKLTELFFYILIKTNIFSHL